jgi:hypothetical protein
MALSAQIALSIIAHETTSGDLSSQMRVTPATYALMLSNGTGANQAQVAFSDSTAIQDNYDNGYAFSAIVDDRGTITMTSVKVIYFKNTGSVSLDIGRNSNWSEGPFTAEIGCVVPPGGVVVLAAPTAAGWPTSEAGAGIAIFNGNGTPGSYDIMLIGEGAIS